MVLVFKKSTRKKMTTWATLLVLLALTRGILGAPVSLCPKQCSCTTSENSVKARCQSLDFLKKSLLLPEQITAIVSLDIQNGPAMKTNPDLSHLRNLKHLTLTSIKIQQVIAAHFPKSLEYLDLSRNSIRTPPEDLHLLPALKEVNLFGNPISCNCDSLAVRDALLKKGISIVKPVKCESPEDVRGKMWLSTTCQSQNTKTLFGDMQGDAPYEGSGSGDIDVVTDTEPIETDDKWGTMEEEFIPVSTSSNVKVEPPQEPATEAPELEGSGDEPEVTTQAIIVEEKQEVTTAAVDHVDGDDDADYYDEDEDFELNTDAAPTTEPPAVTVDMSLLEKTRVTTAAVDHVDGDDDDDYYDEDEDFELNTDAAPTTEPPAVTVDMSLLEKTRVRACNFNCSTPSPLSESNETDVSPPPNVVDAIRIVVDDIFKQPETTSTSTTTTTTTTEKSSTISVVPEERGRAFGTEINKTSSDAEIFENDLKTGEKENIQEPKQSSNSTYIFLSVLLVVIICLVIYAIVKKRSIRRNRQGLPHQPEEKEKIPEEVELIKKVAPENDKPNGKHETITLMNGHKENQHKSDAELIFDTNDGSKVADDDEDVELRPQKAEQESLLTPEAKRVTIKASEIPNSTPKTPILVTRHVNSDGSIVTTPSVDQDV